MPSWFTDSTGSCSKPAKPLRGAWEVVRPQRCNGVVPTAEAVSPGRTHFVGGSDVPPYQHPGPLAAEYGITESADQLATNLGTGCLAADYVLLRCALWDGAAAEKLMSMPVALDLREVNSFQARDAAGRHRTIEEA
jgi:hypothetical protein